MSEKRVLASPPGAATSGKRAFVMYGSSVTGLWGSAPVIPTRNRGFEPTSGMRANGFRA